MLDALQCHYVSMEALCARPMNAEGCLARQTLYQYVRTRYFVPPPPVFVAFFFSVFCESRFVRFYGLGATVSSSVSIAEASREVT